MECTLTYPELAQQDLDIVRRFRDKLFQEEWVRGPGCTAAYVAVQKIADTD